MNTVLGHLLENAYAIYLDNVLIIGFTFRERSVNLVNVLESLYKVGFR